MSGREIRIKNVWFEQGDDVYIMIVRRDGSTYCTVVSSPEFYERVAPLPVTWVLKPAKDTNYVYAKDYSGNRPGQQGGGKTIWLHRVVSGLHDGDRRQVDHISRNGMDNRRSNLQIVTPQQNQMRSQMSSRPLRRNITGIRNVRRIGNKFGVVVAGRWYGTYNTLEEAGCVAEKVRKQLNLYRLQIRFRPDGTRVDTPMEVQ